MSAEEMHSGAWKQHQEFHSWYDVPLVALAH
jgi:hypothetical protein